LGLTNILVSAKTADWLILSALVGVDKMLLYSSRIQTTCTRKYSKTSQDSYFLAMLTEKFSQNKKFDCNLRYKSPNDAKFYSDYFFKKLA